MSITVNVDLPTDNNDCLAGTLLDPVPGPGVLELYVASSQRDGVVTVTGATSVAGLRTAPVLRANGIPDLEADEPFLVPTPGGKVQVVYDEVTAGDAFLTCVYHPLSEL